MIHTSPTSADAIPSRRHQRRTARLEEILDTAERIVYGDGLSALSMHRVAKAMGVAVGGLYRYVASKDAVLVALARRGMAAYAAAAARGCDAARALEPMRRIARIAPLLGVARAYEAEALAEPERFWLMNRMLHEPRTLVADAGARAQVIVGFDVAMAWLAERLGEAEGRGRGALRPGDRRERAVMFWSGLTQAIGLAKLGRLGAAVPTPRRAVRCAVDQALIAWGADARALDEAWPLIDALSFETTAGLITSTEDVVSPRRAGAKP